MAAWAEDELGRISESDDLYISPFREDGVTYGTPTWIWSVVVDDGLYVRAYNGQKSRWYQAALSRKAGRIQAAGLTKEVGFEPVPGALNDRIDEAYRAKYGTSPYLGPMIGAQARGATVRVVPREVSDRPRGMRRPMTISRRTFIAVATLAASSLPRGDAAAEPPQDKEQHMEITRNGSQPSTRGKAEYFTGTVRVDPLFQPHAPARTGAGSVTFEPGARSAWHTHPLGQTLLITAGCGWVQREGGSIEEVHSGDVIWIPPGEKHWHGATATMGMTHIAIQEAVDGKVVDWLEHVTDEQYRK